MAIGAKIVEAFEGDSDNDDGGAFAEAIKRRGYSLGKNATAKDSGRQWNDDEGKDEKWRLIEAFHELSQDEAEAQAGQSDIFEHDNTYLTPKIRAVVFFAKKQEAIHEELYNSVARALEDDDENELDEALEGVRMKTEDLLDELYADAEYGVEEEE